VLWAMPVNGLFCEKIRVTAGGQRRSATDNTELAIMRIGRIATGLAGQRCQHATDNNLHMISLLQCHWALISRVCAIDLQIGDDKSTPSDLYFQLPPSDPRALACPFSLGRRSTPRPLPRPLPVDSPHLRLLGCYFPETRNHNRNHRKNNSRSLSAHGLHILPHSDSRHHHFFEILMRFPRVPPPPANCSSLEVMYTVPGLQAMIYM
jgi:hypothetical protein